MIEPKTRIHAKNSPMDFHEGQNSRRRRPDHSDNRGSLIINLSHHNDTKTVYLQGHDGLLK